jgi:hypothetical protein
LPHKYFAGQISQLALSFPEAWMKAAFDAQQEGNTLVTFTIPAVAEVALVKEIEKLLEMCLKSGL